MKLLALLLLFSMLLTLAACGGCQGGNGTGDGVGGDGTGNNGGSNGGSENGDKPEKLDPVEVLPGFDYTTVDLTQYVSFGDWKRQDMTISVAQLDEITDEDVVTEFNSYFNKKDSIYYKEVADRNKAVANGDVVYMYYTGVSMRALEQAVKDGKIADVRCTGMTYSQILALSLGFDGGTTDSVTPLEIGSKSYIDGFESGLVGYVPSAAGEENPVRLELSFPENYGNADLAGH
ncbi:MAG: hypothetical protein IJY20_07120 [Clostridia bacterium]|nr:hypothetical protein [Clostridia bacterium]